MIVRLSWNGNDRLAGNLRISLPGAIGGLLPSIQGRKVFGRLIVDDLGMFEDRLLHDRWLQGEEMREARQQSEGNQMACARLKESIPWKISLHEHIWPEGGRGRPKIERVLVARRDEIAQVGEKNPAP